MPEKKLCKLVGSFLFEALRYYSDEKFSMTIYPFKYVPNLNRTLIVYILHLFALKFSMHWTTWLLTVFLTTTVKTILTQIILFLYLRMHNY
jgi:hypothetical protein